jgi:D-alanine-D-alanine ligase
VPGGGLYDRHEAAAGHVLPPPYVIKPNAEGSSVGVFIVEAGSNAAARGHRRGGCGPGDQVLVEPYIPGLELAVGVMDGRAMTVTEIVPASGFYDYAAKYAEGGSVHVLPARHSRRSRRARPADGRGRARRPGVLGVTRSDLRYDDVNDILVLLEVNTQPGMTPTSLVPEQAAAMGVAFDQLVLWMTEDAHAAALREGSSARPTGQGAAPAAARGRTAAPDGGLSAPTILLAALGVLVAALVIILATGERRPPGRRRSRRRRRFPPRRSRVPAAQPCG